ncbi:MAG: hypothetical protein ABIR39_12420 [Nocardioides sp.]|uniref:SCO7613 C-terminal domain-containing membrane protein n=1 Tax=Nocardioides sp. TaxID=35761 RepID=UPI003265AE58
MFTYADAQACPGCRAPLAPSTPSCGLCGLSLSGPDAGRMFALLKQVDQAVAGMYAAADRARVPAPPQPAPAYVPMQQPAQAARSAMSSATVPKILLGLGAMCLLVAALVFLAVAWAMLGVEGRTIVLAVFASVAGVLTVVVARRGLRAGAESLAAVTLGIFALVLNGAWRSGWLGSIGEEPFLVVAGLTVAVAAVAATRWAATMPVGALISPEVIAILGVATAALGLPGTIDAGEAVATLAALSLFAVAAVAGHSLGLRFLTIGALCGAGFAWLVLVFLGVLRLDGELSLAHLWGDLAVWPLVVAAALAAAVAVPRRIPAEARVAAAATAALLGTLVLAAAVFDESPTRIALVELAVVAAYAAIATRLPGLWKWVCAAPSVIAALGLGVSVVRLAAVAVGDLVLNEPWSRGLLDRVDAPDVPLTWPLLLPAGVIGISVTVATLMHCSGRLARWVIVPGTAAAVVALTLLPTLYGAPLVLAVGAVVAAAGALTVTALRLRRVDLGVAAIVMTVLALLGGLASDWATAGVLTVITAAAIAAEARGKQAAAGVLLAPLTGAALIWTIGHLVDLDTVWRALPVLLVLGIAIVARPDVEREVAAGAAAFLAVAGSVLGTGTFEQTWLAIYLTLAGVVCTVSALLHRDRRTLAWVGLALLTLAQWVRLEQLGVGTVEAYTLPLALVLLVVGTVALLRGDDSSISTLSPGLGLALVPSLLLVLMDPVGLRAVLLGLACIVLVAIGLARGWAAPLLAGASVGALLVLRQATFAQVIPQWMLIGLVGVALTIVGVTWEQRLQEFRKASAYVRGLR